MIRRPPRSPLFPYPPLSRSVRSRRSAAPAAPSPAPPPFPPPARRARRTSFRPRVFACSLPVECHAARRGPVVSGRSEEHTSELQSRQYLVCRLLLEKKKKKV